MRRILFLDIDGVLNHENWYHSVRNGTAGNYFNQDIDPGCIKLLNLLPNNVEVVISSSWRFTPNTVDILKGSGLILPIVGGTDHYYNDWICRGNEIQKWLCDNLKDQDYEYVIIDDDCDMLLSQVQHFIHVNDGLGLNRHHIDKVKTILKI